MADDKYPGQEEAQPMGYPKPGMWSDPETKESSKGSNKDGLSLADAIAYLIENGDKLNKSLAEIDLQSRHVKWNDNSTSSFDEVMELYNKMLQKKDADYGMMDGPGDVGRDPNKHFPDNGLPMGVESLLKKKALDVKLREGLPLFELEVKFSSNEVHAMPEIEQAMTNARESAASNDQSTFIESVYQPKTLPGTLWLDVHAKSLDEAINLITPFFSGQKQLQSKITAANEAVFTAENPVDLWPTVIDDPMIRKHFAERSVDIEQLPLKYDVKITYFTPMMNKEWGFRNTYAFFLPDRKSIYVNPKTKWDSARSSIIHELEHVIQVETGILPTGPELKEKLREISYGEQPWEWGAKFQQIRQLKNKGLSLEKVLAFFADREANLQGQTTPLPQEAIDQITTLYEMTDEVDPQSVVGALATEVIQKHADSLQRGQAYITRTLDKMDIEIDRKVEEILRSNMTEDQKHAAITERINELFYELDNISLPVQIRDEEWSPAEVNTSDIQSIIEEFAENAATEADYLKEHPSTPPSQQTPRYKPL